MVRLCWAVMSLISCRSPALRALFQHGGPGRTFQLDLVIPFRIMVGLGNRLLAFHFVEGLAHVFIGEQLSVQHPDFLRIVAGVLDVDFVGELHQADVLAHLLGRFVTRRHRLVEIELLELPEVAVVVAVRRGEQIGARIEGNALGHEFMRQLHADIPGHLVGIEALRRLFEQYPSLGDPRIIVLIAVIQQGARQTVQVIACGFALTRILSCAAAPTGA